MAEAEMAMIEPHEKLTILAKIAEHAGSPSDMRDFMKERLATGVPLNADERDMLSAAYKGLVSELRAAMDTTVDEVDFCSQNGNPKQAESAQAYGVKLGALLRQICMELHEVVEPLLGKAEIGEPTVFYLKLKADYFRYMAENPFKQGKGLATIEDCRAAYVAALKEADKHLLTTHPVRLSLALNYSVFQHEVLCETEAAINTAATARRGALEALSGMPEEASQDAMSAITRLEDNLKTWTDEVAMGVQREAEKEALEECDNSFSPKGAQVKEMFHRD